MEESKDLAPLDSDSATAKNPIAPAPEIKTPGKVTPAADSDGLEAVPGPSGAGGLGPATAGGGALGRPITRPRPRPAPRKRANPWGWVFVVLVAIGAGVGTYYYVRSTQTNPAFVGSTTTVSSRLPVSVAISSSGQVLANADQNIAFSTGGTITKLNKKLGDTVKAGDVIAEIDNSDLQFALQSAQSSYDQQLASYNTSIAGATQKDLDVAQAQLDSAKANYNKTVNGTATAEDVASANAAIASANASAATANGQVAVAQANLKSAQAKLAQDKAGPTASDLSSANAAIASAEASLANAKANQAKVLAGNDAATIASAQSTYDQAVANQQKSLSQLNLTIASDQIAKDQALNALKDAQDKYQAQVTANRNADGSLKSNLSQSAIDAETTALRAMQDAQSTYNKADLTLNDANIQLQTQTRTLQSTVDNAKAQLDKAKAGPTQADIASAASSVASAQSGLESAKKALIALTPTDATIAADEASVASAQQAILSAQAGITSSKASVASSQANLAKLRGGTPDDIATAEASVKQAQATLDDLKSGPKPNDIAIAKAQLAVSQTNLDKAKAAMTAAQLKSPIDGTVISSTVTTGQLVTASTIVYEVVDLSSLHVDVNVGETDISKIKEGMPVALNLDGIANKSFTGKVTFISSKAVVTSNVVNYTVTVTLDQGTANSLVEYYPTEFAKLLQRPGGATGNFAGRNGANGAASGTPGASTTPGAATTPSATGNQGANPGAGTGAGGNGGGIRGGSAALASATGVCGYTLSSNTSTEQPKIGMTANVTFCLNLKAGVLSLPNRAIKTHTVNGVRSSYVTILEDAKTNKTKDVNILTGLAGDSYTEITGGEIKDGDVVVISTTGTGTTTTGGGGGFGGGGFGGGGFGGGGGGFAGPGR